jgi:hypothetical protein
MNNIQLAIFLEKYRAMLDNALAQVIIELPEETKSVTKNILGREEVNYPILDPIYEIFGQLEDDIELLKKNNEVTVNNNVNR